jgi:hypothetical protein
MASSSIAIPRAWNGRKPLPPISGYAPLPDRSAWMLVLVLAAVLYLALTLPR